MRCEPLLMTMLIGAMLAGCAPQQPYLVAPQMVDIGTQGNDENVAGAETHHIAQRALPYKLRLADGDATELPPAIAKALSNDAPLTFSYREQLTHDEYHIPMIVSAIDPVTYFGSPLGDYGVTAFATLTISKGDRVLADYTAKAYLSKSYNLYSEPKHSELERAARDAVRRRIEQKLFADADRVSHASVTE